jgi:hypothetical protein
VIEEKESTEMGNEPKLEMKGIKIKESIGVSTKEKSTQTHPKAQGCTHEFGYLSKRSSKEKIPEECMMCESIVQCMLRNVTS